MGDTSSSLDIETSSVENKIQCTGVWIFLIVCLTVTICIMTWLITRSTDSPCEPDGSSIYTPKWYTGSLRNPIPNVTDPLTTFKINFPPLQSIDYMVGVFKNHNMSDPGEISSPAVDGCEISIKQRTYKAPDSSEWDSDKSVLSSNSIQYVNGELMFAGTSAGKGTNTTTMALYTYKDGESATHAINPFNNISAKGHVVNFGDGKNISGLILDTDNSALYFNYDSSLDPKWSDPIEIDNIEVSDDACCRVFGTDTGGFISTGKTKETMPHIYYVTTGESTQADTFNDINLSRPYSKSVVDIAPLPTATKRAISPVPKILAAYMDKNGAMQSRILTCSSVDGGDTMKTEAPIEVFNLNREMSLKAHTFGRIQEDIIPLYVLYSLTASNLYLAQYNYNTTKSAWGPQANKSVLVGTLDPLDESDLTPFNVMAIADPWGTSGDAICIQNVSFHNKTLVISSNGEAAYVSCENFDDEQWTTLTEGRRLIFPINDDTRLSALEIVKHHDKLNDVLRVTAKDELTYFVLGK